MGCVADGAGGDCGWDGGGAVRVDKTACDVCSTEHKTEDKATNYASTEMGTWIQLTVEASSSMGGPDREAEHSLDVCNRDSCVAKGFAMLLELVARDATAAIGSWRRARMNDERKKAEA